MNASSFLCVRLLSVCWATVLALGAPSALATQAPTPPPAVETPPAQAGSEPSAPVPEDDDVQETAAPEPTIANAAFTTALKSPPEDVVKRCGAPIAGMDEVLTPGGMLLLGEIHGTREIPAFVGTLGCHVASAGVPVVVGLELPREEQRALRRYLKSRGDKQARASLIEGSFWRRPYQDGRGSEALIALVERLRMLRAQGLSVSVFAFDAPGQGNPRAASMAHRVLEVRKAAPKSTFLLLGGNGGGELRFDPRHPGLAVDANLAVGPVERQASHVDSIGATGHPAHVERGHPVGDDHVLAGALQGRVALLGDELPHLGPELIQRARIGDDEVGNARSPAAISAAVGRHGP